LSSGLIRLSGKVWSEEFEEERLAGWITFYEKMFSQYGHAGYQEAAAALTALPPVNA